MRLLNLLTLYLNFIKFYFQYKSEQNYELQFKKIEHLVSFTFCLYIMHLELIQK